MNYGSYNRCQPFYVLNQFFLNVSNTAAVKINNETSYIVANTKCKLGAHGRICLI